MGKEREFYEVAERWLSLIAMTAITACFVALFVFMFLCGCGK